MPVQPEKMTAILGLDKFDRIPAVLKVVYHLRLVFSGYSDIRPDTAPIPEPRAQQIRVYRQIFLRIPRRTVHRDSVKILGPFSVAPFALVLLSKLLCCGLIPATLPVELPGAYFLSPGRFRCSFRGFAFHCPVVIRTCFYSLAVFKFDQVHVFLEDLRFPFYKSRAPVSGENIITWMYIRHRFPTVWSRYRRVKRQSLVILPGDLQQGRHVVADPQRLVVRLSLLIVGRALPAHGAQGCHDQQPLVPLHALQHRTL